MSNPTTAELTMGLDLGDRYSSFCLLDANGEVVQEGRVATVEAAMVPFVRSLTRMRVVLEVGTQSPWVSRLIRAAGHDVIVANARKLGLISRSAKKNDRSDAETLARLGRSDPKLLSPIAHRSKEAQEDLAKLRGRAALVRSRTDLINHVRGAVKSSGNRLPRCDADTFHRHAALAMPAELRPALMPLVETIAGLTTRIKEMDRLLERMANERYPQTQLLRQVRGVGPLVALSYVLTLEDPGRFARSRQVGAYLGLTPRQHQSGEQQPQLRITKTGDSSLRALLVQAAHYILGRRGPDCDLRRWGLARMERGGKNAKKRALVAVARKLSVLLHRLWVSGEVYRPFRQEVVAA